MDKLQAKTILPFVQALAEGKVIQYRDYGFGTWQDILEPTFIGHTKEYRIKPEPKTVPLTIEDLYEHFKKGTIFTNSTTHTCRIQSISIKKKQLIMPTSFSNISIVDFLLFWTFEDGSPLTKIVEE